MGIINDTTHTAFSSDDTQTLRGVLWEAWGTWMRKTQSSPKEQVISPAERDREGIHLGTAVHMNHC